MKTTFTATGDSFTTRRIHPDYPGYRALSEFFHAHDVNFNNLEMTFHRAEGYPSAFSGGTWAMADPEILDDLKGMGLNLFTTANNHSMDYSHGGLLATCKYLREKDMVYSGTGENLYEASKACYLETPQSRVALISITTDFHDSDIAGPQGPTLGGRPGLNVLRSSTTYHVTGDDFDVLSRIAEESKMNAYLMYGIQLGYVKPLPEGRLVFANQGFVKDERNFTETKPNAADLKRTVEEIQEAKRQADYVMVSLHCHNFSSSDFNRVPEYVEEFAHACVDAGADAILGHGPHELRGIELYRGKPIFYSLGNFFFQTETVEKQPAEAFLDKNFPADAKVGAYMSQRSANGTRGYCVQPPIWFSVIPEWTVEDGAITELRLHPITLGMELPRSRKGSPAFVDKDPEFAAKIFAHLQDLCKPYGTQIRVEGNIGTVKL